MTLQHRLEYAGFRIIRALLGILPERAARWLGSFLGWLAGSVLRVRRDVVLTNLRRAFPDRSEGWYRRTASASYRHLGRESIATFLLDRETPASIRDRTEIVEGFEAVQAAHEAGKGLILLTGHFGNWEIGGAAMAARGIPLDGVATTQKNPAFNRDLVESRERLGIRIVPRREAPRRLLRSLGAGRAAGLVADQNVHSGGVLVPFFGTPASTAKGAAVFSLRTGAPIFVGAAVALPGPRYRYRIRIQQVRIETTGDLERDTLELTAAHTRALEEAVREAPEQYFWVHKRWKERELG